MGAIYPPEITVDFQRTNIQCVQVSRKLGDSVERTQNSSQITAAAADNGVSHGADTRASSVGLSLLLQ
jgi:hypothetical protein